MKKLLNSLAALTILSSSTATLFACSPKNDNTNTGDNNTDDNTDNEGDNGDNGGDGNNGGDGSGENEVTNTQTEMLKGAEFISRLIVGGKHENLNYNINEILSIFLTPSPVAMNMPVSYNYDGQSINIANNINKFKNYLAPSFSSYNGDGYAGMFASYIMGMYDNEFYEDMINGDSEGVNNFYDTFSKSGNQGYNKSANNAMGYAAGLGSEINLSTNTDRRNLAWGIQDTGALSNYLLNLGFDGANPTDTNGTSGPKSAATDKVGTNGSGYAWYNSILMNGAASKTVDFKGSGWLAGPISLSDGKLKGQTYAKADSTTNQSTINGNNFNSTGALISKVAGKQNVNGYISMFGSMLENVSDTKNGALVLAEFLNILYPMINLSGGSIGNQTNMMQSVGISLTGKVWESLKELQGNEVITSDSLNKKIAELDSAPTYSLLGASSPKLSSLYKQQSRDLVGTSTNAKDIVAIIDELQTIYDSYEDKAKFNELVFWGADSPFNTIYSKKGLLEPSLMSYIGEENWKKTMIGENNDGGMNLLQFVKGFYSLISDTRAITQLELIIDTFADENTFRDLTTAKKNKLLTMLGWTQDGYLEDSLAGHFYNSFKNTEVTGQKDFVTFFSNFKDLVATAMEEVHEPVLQYLVDDKFWKTSEFKINTTSNTQLGGKMEFTLGYEGVGDTTSSASEQTKQVTVGDNFNPYQTIAANQNSKWTDALKAKLSDDKIMESGKVLGLEQGIITEDQLVSYDGLGNYQDYDSVQNSYKIVWENISDNSDVPYWVITSIKSYNKSGVEFFNIY